MKRFVQFALFGALLLGLNACMFVGGVKGNGEVAEENRPVEMFESVDVSGSANVLLVPSKEPYVKVITDENLLELVVTEVRGKELKVYFEKNIRSYEKQMIEVGYDELNAIELSGAVEIANQGSLRSENLEIDCSGAADLTLDVRVASLHLDLSGAGEIELSGKAKELHMEISGAAEVHADELVSEDVEIDCSGAAMCKVHARKSLDVQASGASEVKYAGKPDKINMDASGASSVEAL